MVDAGEREGENTTAFTEILENLVAGVSGSLGAVFVDDLGESVDYYSTIDPFELKVIGACGALLIDGIQRTQGVVRRVLVPHRLQPPSRGSRVLRWPLLKRHTRHRRIQWLRRHRPSLRPRRSKGAKAHGQGLHSAFQILAEHLRQWVLITLIRK